MKKVYLLITAICLTALTGCIKEEPFTLEEATIEVNLDTRSGAVSEQQGDRIEDVMIWVFKDEANNWNTLAGWRTYTPPTGTDVFAHTSLTLHIPVALCNGDSEKYRLVAVLNKGRWGTNLNLSSETTYAELTSMKFANSELIEQAIEENTPGTPSTPDNPGTSGDPGNPEAMPVSHWCDVTVTKTDTHANGQCATANLDVFRSIAKTQLFVTKASNDFNLVIKSATLKSSNAPTEGMVLSSVAAADLKATNAAPAWFGTNAPTQFNTSFSQSLKKADGTAAAVTVAPKAEKYQDVFVGSAFLYENAVGSSEWNVEANGGYCLAVEYSVDGGTNFNTENVWLPPVARNHDYQVHATVDAGGKMTLTFNVQPWTDVPTNWNYTDVVTINENGKLAWTSGTYEKIEDSATEENVKKVTMKKTGDGNYTNLQCTFHIDTPTDATWYASFISGDINSFEFVGANSGPVGEAASLTIKAKNSTITSSQMANLDIVIRTADGRTLKSSELTNGVTYQLVQNE